MSTSNGSGNGVRSGAQTLALLAAPLNVVILQALAQGPRRQADLRRATDSPAQTTLRAHLRDLSEIGAIAKHRRNRFPGLLEFELTEPGRDLLAVAETLEQWLRRAPGEPHPLGGEAARAAINALAEGWSTKIVRALAAGPRSLTELDQVISPLSYPALERRLGAMRASGHVEALAGEGRGTPYAVTAWLRQAVAPLAAAARWERRHLAESRPPLAPLDTEAAFLLAAPLLRLPAELSGSCRIAVDIPNGAARQMAGVLVEVETGRIASYSARLEGAPEAWASGTTGAWLASVIDADDHGLELGGDCQLARAVLDGLRGALFGVALRS